MNVGLIASVGRAFYTEPHLRKDAKAISATVAGALAILSAEGFAAAKYAQTPAGQAEAQRAKEEGSILYRHTREVVLRPGVLGGLVGLGKYGGCLNTPNGTHEYRSKCWYHGHRWVLRVHQLGQASLG